MAVSAMARIIRLVLTAAAMISLQGIVIGSPASAKGQEIRLVLNSVSLNDFTPLQMIPLDSLLIQVSGAKPQPSVRIPWTAAGFLDVAVHQEILHVCLDEGQHDLVGIILAAKGPIVAPAANPGPLGTIDVWTWAGGLFGAKPDGPDRNSLGRAWSMGGSGSHYQWTFWHYYYVKGPNGAQQKRDWNSLLDITPYAKLVDHC